MVTPPAAIDAVQSLAFCVLLGLDRDDAIAHILTKLHVWWTAEQFIYFHVFSLTFA
jgi:hypothetical protein